MRITYRITKEDFLEAQKFYLNHSGSRLQRVFRRVFIWFWLAITCMALVFQTAPSSVIRKETFPAIPAGIIIIVIFWLVPRLAANRAFSRDVRIQKEMVAEFSDGGMHITTGNSNAMVAWTDCLQFGETKTLFMVFQSPQLFNVFPKKAFSNGEVGEFRTLLSKYLKSA